MRLSPQINLQNPADLDVTVVLCTYNRCQDLRTTLESVAASELPASVAWEVLVVDNNSTDRTREVVEDFCHRYSERFRYLFEPKSGKTYALNTGVANARGKVLAFVDDDVTVAPAWLHNLTAELYDGEWVGSGGRTLPAQAITPPRWLSGDVFDWPGMVWGSFDLGNSACELRRAPYGANMAFRRSVFEKHGGFRIDLGPQPNSRVLNDDTEFGRRLLASGERLRYEPSAIIYHPVAQERLTKEYFLSCWFNLGRATIREVSVWPDVYGIPRDYFRFARYAAEMPILALRCLLGFSQQQRFRARCHVWHRAGMMFELHHRFFKEEHRQSRHPVSLGGNRASLPRVAADTENSESR